MGLREAEITEMEGRATVAGSQPNDPVVWKSYAVQAAMLDVPALIKALRESYNEGGGGGDFGHLLREALKSRILSQAVTEDTQRIVELSDDVKVHSLAVSTVNRDGQVYVDVRLLVGSPPPEGIG